MEAKGHYHCSEVKPKRSGIEGRDGGPHTQGN